MTLSSTNTHRRALGQQGKQHGRPAEIDPRIFTRAEAEEARGTVPPLPRVIVNTSAERKAPVRSAGTGRATGAGSSQSCTPDFTPRACGQIVLGSVWHLAQNCLARQNSRRELVRRFSRDLLPAAHARCCQIVSIVSVHAMLAEAAAGSHCAQRKARLRFRVFWSRGMGPPLPDRDPVMSPLPLRLRRQAYCN